MKVALISHMSEVPGNTKVLWKCLFFEVALQRSGMWTNEIALLKHLWLETNQQTPLYNQCMLFYNQTVAILQYWETKSPNL